MSITLRYRCFFPATPGEPAAASRTPGRAETRKLQKRVVECSRFGGCHEDHAPRIPFYLGGCRLGRAVSLAGGLEASPRLFDPGMPEMELDADPGLRSRERLRSHRAARRDGRPGPAVPPGVRTRKAQRREERTCRPRSEDLGPRELLRAALT